MHFAFYMASIVVAIAGISLVIFLNPKSHRRTLWWTRDAIFVIAALMASSIVAVAAYALVGRGFP